MMGTVEELCLESIVEAVRVILDPSSTSTTRAAAHNLCERVKSHPMALQLGFQLSSITMPLPTRLFGLNVLENFVRSRLVVEGSMNLRDGVWSLLALVVEVRPEERRLMQDKTAMLVAQLAMRIWPQYWPDFFDKLLELVTDDGKILEQDPAAVIRAEMGLLMARMVVDEIHPREGNTEKLVWDDSRRPELQKALAVVLPLMMKRIYSLLPHCSAWNTNEMTLMKPLIEALMEAFGSISLWTPLEKEPVIFCLNGILEIARKCPDLTGVALEVLMTFSSRPSRPQEIDIMPAAFDSIVDNVRNLLGLFAANIDSFDYFKKLADVFVTMASTHIAIKKTILFPKRLDAVLDVLFQLSNFPSLLIVSNVGLFWNSIARNEKIMTHSAMIDRLPSLFLYSLVTWAQSKAEIKRSPYNLEDFDEDDKEADADFEALFSTHQNRTMDLLRLISSYHPDILAGYCSNAIGTFLAERPTTGPTTGLAADIGPVSLRQWDALMHATAGVLKSCLSKIEGDLESEVSQRITSQVSQLGGILCNGIDVAKLHPEVLCLWFVTMKSLIPALGMTKSPLFSPLMQQLFALTLSYEIPKETNWPAEKIPSMTFAVKARAGSSILKICHIRPQLFLPALDYIVGLFRQQQNGGNREKRLFTEMLLVIAGCMEGSAQRVELVKLVLAPIAESLETFAPASTGNLLERSGLDSELFEVSTQTSVLYRQGVMNLSSTLYIVLSQLKKLAIAGDIKSLINQFVPSVAALVTRQILATHGAFDKRSFSASSQDRWQGLFGEDILANETPATEKLLDASVLADSMADDSVTGKSLKGWFYMFRVSTYLNYGILFGLAPTIMYTRSNMEGIEAMLLQNHETFSITQWTLLTKHLISPMLLSIANETPSRAILMLILEKFGCVQLEAAWQTFLARQQNQTELTVETALETLLTTATSALLSMIYSILCPVNERDKRVDPSLDVLALRDPSRLTFAEPSHSSLAKWLVADEALYSKVVLLLSAMTRWKASLCLGKICSILMRWLPTFMERPILHETLFGPILASLLAAISSSTLSDHHATVIAALTELYKWQIYFNYSTFDSQITTILNDPSITQELRNYFTTTTGNVKSQRGFVKMTLIRPLQRHALSATGITSIVPKLPDRLVMIKRLKSTEEDVNLDLASFFDQ